MIWIDYTIEQEGTSFRVKGEWDGEVWQERNGTPKKHVLYKPGDIFIVGEDGWLHKTDELSTLVLTYESRKKQL